MADEGEEQCYAALVRQTLIRFEPPLLARVAAHAVPTPGYLDLPPFAPVEISHLQMNNEKHLVYWGSRTGTCKPGWISSSDLVF
jgi:hypothetical protein